MKLSIFLTVILGLGIVCSVPEKIYANKPAKSNFIGNVIAASLFSALVSDIALLTSSKKYTAPLALSSLLTLAGFGVLIAQTLIASFPEREKVAMEEWQKKYGKTCYFLLGSGLLLSASSAYTHFKK